MLRESAYWDPVFILFVLLLMFWQTCSSDMLKRNFLLQTGLLLFYMAATTAVAGLYMLEPDRDPRENMLIAGVTVFFFSSALGLAYAARGRARDYGGGRAAFMYALLGSSAVAALLFYAHHGALTPPLPVGLPFAVTACLLLCACTLALLLEGVAYDLLVFRDTNAHVVLLYALSCVCGVFGYYLYMSRGLTQAFVL